MAITPVPNNYEGFIFGGVNSRTYGVYITDPAVFNAPKRDVDMISIPGRNGAYALDRGRFENIEVTYHCAMGAGNESDYLSAISDLRNILASKTGYVRLTDEINTTEYRMAVFKDGLDVSSLNKKTGTFDVKFEAKPQRFLTSGETKSAVANGGTINNPTLFDAHPLLETVGTGTIGINSDPIIITNNPIGVVTLAQSTNTYIGENPLTVDTSMMATGDTITLEAGTKYSLTLAGLPDRVTALNNVTMTGNMTGNASGYATKGQGWIDVTLDAVTFQKGTSATMTNTVSCSVTATISGVSTTATKTLTITITYDGSNSFSFTAPTGTGMGTLTWHDNYYQRPTIIGDSTMLAISGTMYFDLDIGEAWTEIGGVVVSVNNSVSFGADLPVLVPGTNTITYDNTITSFKITPRWWKV